jgi:hypothetical protein
MASTEGGRVATVMRPRRSVSSSAAPGRSASRDASTSVAPVSSASNSSATAASNENEANCRTRLVPSMPKRRACAYARLGMPRWGTITPLGVPVLPEV